MWKTTNSVGGPFFLSKGDHGSNLQIFTSTFFNKQPVYEQLALGCQTAKQLLGINLASISNNKNFRLLKSGVFPLQIKVEPTIHQNSNV